ncbi:MAG: phage portal protein [Halanaerobiales bacterium]
MSQFEQNLDRYSQYSNKRKMELGEKYYNQQNEEIMKRKKEYYSDESSRPVEDPFRANNKLPSGYMKLLVKQKVAYSINDKLAVKGDGAEDIEETLGKMWRNDLKKAGEVASKKLYAVWQFYLDNEENLSYKRIPSEQVIPYYKEGKLTKVIRYYKENREIEGQEKELEVAELWDDEKVTYYFKKDGQWLISYHHSRNPRPHILNKTSMNNKVIDEEADNWGRPPFAILWNNDEEQTDLDPIKRYIDIYDIVDSDFSNNIEDFQDAWWVLKNFGGQDIDEFFEQLKKFKAIKVDEGGEAHSEKMDIPTEARMKFLDKTEKLIYKFGMGVNPDDIEGNITNVRIKALYSNLDLKANDFEQEVRKFFYDVLYFINRHRKSNNENEIDPEGVELEFDRSMLINEVEKAELANDSQGRLSEPTRLSHDPRVKDAEEEIEIMKQERSDYVDLDNLGNEDDEDDDPDEE